MQTTEPVICYFSFLHFSFLPCTFSHSLVVCLATGPYLTTPQPTQPSLLLLLLLLQPSLLLLLLQPPPLLLLLLLQLEDGPGKLSLYRD
jgi:hypothetical protein